MTVFEMASMDNPTATLVSIGCNKGDDLANKMRYWSRNASYSHDLMLPYVVDFQGGRACPMDPEADINASSGSIRPVRGFCVEAMKSTFDTVHKMYNMLKWDTEVKVIYAAMSSVPGVAEFPRHASGFEAFGLGSDTSLGTHLVNVSTVDELVDEHELQSIDILSIDTEGNDMRVIFGAVHSLSKVRLLEFEYHGVNRWQYSDLQDLVDLLDQFNFDCYWPLNDGRLLRLTECWDDSYYAKRSWSNVVCCNRDEVAVHRAMTVLSSIVDCHDCTGH
jgi:FkbM family methyltransferase